MNSLDQIPLARFQVELHTENPMWGFRVRDTETDETYGFGLTILDAGRLAQDHEAAARPPAWGYFSNDAEANEWLEFDCSERDEELYSRRSPDQFEEWHQRRAGTWHS